MKKILLAVLSVTALAITTPANAKFLENLTLSDGRIIAVTDNKESPGPGFQFVGCGTLPNTNTPACSWLPLQAAAVQAPQQTATSSGVMTLEQFNASQPAVSTASYNAPATQVQQVSTNVADQPNPLVGGAKPTSQVAYQHGTDGSWRVVTKQPGPSFIQTVLGLAVGAALVTEAVRGNSYYGGVTTGPFISGGSCGGCERR